MPTLSPLLLVSLLGVCVSTPDAGGSSHEGSAGLGNTNDSFIEDGVDKSPIRGIGQDGHISAKGLGDDESFKPPPFADALAGDPACDGAGPAWKSFREQLAVAYPTVEEDEDLKAYASLQMFLDLGLRNFTKLDKEANRCFLGVCALLYHLSRHRMMVENNYYSAASMARSLDRFTATVHPSKFDDANLLHTGKPIWPVSDFLVGKLMRDILGASRGRGPDVSCGSEQGCIKGAKPMHGNAFHAFGNDTLPVAPHMGEDRVTMDNAFKVYVYDIADYEELLNLTAGAAFCKDNQWGFEVLLHYYFLACDCRTETPAEADFFFVPHYTACHLNVKTFEEEQSNELFKSLIPKLKHFRRSSGRDHLFVWGGGFAVDGPFRDWKTHIQKSIFLMTETEFWNPYRWQTETNFHQAKDIVLPGRISLREMEQHNKLALPMEMRSFTGDFVGWNRPLHAAQGRAESPRQRLLKWAARFEDMHIRQDVPYEEALKGSVTSRFCFVPRGKSAWSSRLFRVLYAKCVPVLLNDDYELPFLSLLPRGQDWIIRWPMRNVTDDLADLLRAATPEALERMVRNAQEPKCWYAWHPPVVDASHFDLQEGDLDAVCPEWRTKNAYVAVMALLYQKRRVVSAGMGTFYMPDPSTQEMRFTDAQLGVV